MNQPAFITHVPLPFLDEAPYYFWGTDFQRFSKIWAQDTWIQGQKYSAQTKLRCYKHLLQDLQYKTKVSANTKNKNQIPEKLILWRQKKFAETLPEIIDYAIDPLDGTEKFIFAHAKQNYEAVLIPSKNRFTLCISTQSGCKLACRFCATGYMGFKANLKSYEIVGQYIQILQLKKKQDELFSIDNLVFMGMGEPLDNFEELIESIKILSDPNGLRFPLRKITVSTSGLLPELIELRKQFSVRIIISLHSLKEAVRSAIMPINRKYSLTQINATLSQINFEPAEKITLSYMLLKDCNDQEDDLNLLIALAQKFPLKINLLPYHAIPHEGAKNLKPAGTEHFEYFKKRLLENNIPTFYRVSKGQNINAACGMLNTQTNSP